MSLVWQAAQGMLSACHAPLPVAAWQTQSDHGNGRHAQSACCSCHSPVAPNLLLLVSAFKIAVHWFFQVRVLGWGGESFGKKRCETHRKESGAGGGSRGGGRKSEEGGGDIRVWEEHQFVARGDGPLVGKPGQRQALAGSQMREKKTKALLTKQISALKLA